jgi:tetrapyrrole methylase family protein/MazG family protein
MDTIQIIGLGVGSLEDLSVKAYKALMEKIPTYLRTERHPIAKEMVNNGIKYNSFDNFFEEFEEFDEIYDKIVKKTVAELKKYGKINYCVPGSPYVGDIVTKKLLEEYKDMINIVLIDNESFLSKCIKLSGYSDYKNIKVLDPNEMDEFSSDSNCVNFITQVDSRLLASEVKIKLMESYSGDCKVLKIDVLNDLVVEMPIYLMDQENNYEFSTYFCILPIEKYKTKVYNINTLCRIVKHLRGPEGCPWDRNQTHESCKGNILEEANELIQSIDNEDIDNMCEELGDVLLQVIFHSEMASEEGYFNISDVTTKLCEKLIRRHPHVFGEEIALTPQQALDAWEKVKKDEKEELNN